MSELPVDVVRSARRTKTVQARVVDGRLRVMIPAAFTHEEETEWVAEMRRRIGRKISSAHIDLSTRAAKLASRHGLPRPAVIEWSDRQGKRWGSCSPSEGSILISRRVADMPAWVLDFVIVHELAHLRVPGHGADFKALVNRYHRAERARGYLMAKAEST